MPELDYYDDYDSLRSDGNVAVVYPIFTQSAYNWKGIHDYYAGYCDSCTSVTISNVYEKSYSASGNGFRILEFLGYQVIDDIDIDKNPQILEKYDKIILLHNEFVTKKEYEAIIHHPKVIYLYPNSLNSEITVDYSKNMITLVRGPDYPQKGIKNGFDWQDDNTPYFNDWNCLDWKFYKAQNGYMLNCYPETTLPNNGSDLLKTIKNL
ncbi:hypothetical protein [Candidatus Nitrosotenuis sp. DW1]|uniref:hypothetical protein n=1 Tax=Candidatus Nitrosotenuis sp. DW1 TaxID=2259672 RepID=UPI0015C81B45|nr:hypothetical protein [Candidatus Nitrosotenuis sp. DW1]QLH08189.1 hypothetical protein DSQ19_00635 [Candidatus Nitrosotenuis sp. DW1]